MAVISFSEATLRKKRQAMQDALRRRDWRLIGDIDLSVNELLQEISVESHCDAFSLLKEVRQVVALYRSILDVCAAESASG
jgi:hypothetical protein